MQTLALALALLVQAAAATNHTNSTSEGLDGGAVAGIIVGVLVVLVIAAMFIPGSPIHYKKVMKMLGMGGTDAMEPMPDGKPMAGVSGGAEASTEARLGNHMPMMALRPAGDEL